MADEDAIAEMLAAAAGDNPMMISSKSALEAEVEEEDLDDEEDETLSERLWGLTEMFPEPVRNFTGAVASLSFMATKSLYNIGRSGLWIATSSAIILAMPVLFEMERSQMEEQQMMQQRQILLGPNAAASGGMMPSVPQMVPPQAAQR